MAGSKSYCPDCELDAWPESRLGNCCYPPEFRGGLGVSHEKHADQSEDLSGLDPVIHLLRETLLAKERWIRGSSPRMTSKTPWPTLYGMGIRRFPWNHGSPRTALLHSSRGPHANPPRQGIRHGLSRYWPRPAAGVRARLAVRLPHLVGGARPPDAKASADRGVPAALFSRALGRRRRHLFDRAARRRRDRLYRKAGY